MVAKKISHSQLEKWVLQIVEERQLQAQEVDPSINPTELAFYASGIQNGARDIISTLVLHGIIEREY